MLALVTGGAGLIGSHIVDLLLENGWDVRILDNFEPVTHPHGQPPWTTKHATQRVSVRRGDVRSESTVMRAMRDVNVVFHQAAFGGFTTDPVKTIATNVAGTSVVMEAARHAGVSKVVMASSQAVYGSRCDRRPDMPEILAGNWDYGCDGEMPVDENYPLSPRTPYALSKYHAERLALGLGEQWGLPVVALRYALTYGPRQSVSNPYTGICSIFATRLMNGFPPVIYEDGQQTRDFTYVEDVARANLLVALAEAADGEVFNVGTGVATSVLAFLEQLRVTLRSARHLPDMPGHHLRGLWRPEDARHMVTDSSKLRRLGWEPTVTLPAGLSTYIGWFLEQPFYPDNFDEAARELASAGIVRVAP